MIVSVASRLSPIRRDVQTYFVMILELHSKVVPITNLTRLSVLAWKLSKSCGE